MADRKGENYKSPQAILPNRAKAKTPPPDPSFRQKKVPDKSAVRAAKIEAELAQLSEAVEAARSLLKEQFERQLSLQNSLEASNQRNAALEIEIVQAGDRYTQAANKEAKAEAEWVKEGLPSMQESAEILSKKRDGWQKQCADLRSKVGKQEKELEALDQETLQGMRERQRIQVECLSLQQECEDARVDLQGAQEFLLEGRASVERMAKRRLELEWEMEKGVQKQADFQQLLQRARQAVYDEVGVEKRQLDDKLQYGQEEMDRQAAQAARHKANAAALQREAAAAGQQCHDLEQAVAAAVAEAESIGSKVEEAKSATEVEKQLEAHAREKLEKTKAKRQALQQRLAELKGLQQNIEAESVGLQEQHARLVMGRARRKAIESLERSRSQEAAQVNGSALKSHAQAAAAPAHSMTGSETAMCQGFFLPAGVGRGPQFPSQSPAQYF
eukprot:TRINITY_DN9011_c1_g1_i2.p1 TRINITY_DN9011_c1_g1~~TRINITY_DN9011_c1_g1_i2.p1  ORF type:complete len:444 (-),score=136.08 TRINITY_DN9011_c1_g1_i2:207-1538(-)